MEPDAAHQKSLIRYAIFMTALTATVLWAAYNVRTILLLLYISGLFAIGFSPIVRLIEKQKLLPVSTTRLMLLVAMRRVPRGSWTGGVLVLLMSRVRPLNARAGQVLRGERLGGSLVDAKDARDGERRAGAGWGPSSAGSGRA